MNIIQRIIKKVLKNLGYEKRKPIENSWLFKNFLNLTNAYEQKINESGNKIIPNNTRPKLLSRLMGTPPSEAYYIIEALANCMDLSGDICEFGVAQGETSALMANEIINTNKKIHLFDSFEGLPKPSEKDQLKDDIFSLGTMEAYTGTMSCPKDMVQARLTAVSFPEERVVIHKGFIEQLIHVDECLPNQVSFAYVDFDFYEPIKIALEFLDSVTPLGAIIIVDDYDFFSTGVKAAVDEFITERKNAGIIYECFVPDTQYGHFAVLKKKE